ncbi:MAG TPA: hypothetical protein VFU73_14760 [Actinocrinis sp.]|nr:hypothetical protein [Actinocrinis sp.]
MMGNGNGSGTGSREAAGALGRLAARVRWLEELTRASGMVPTADLFAAGPDDGLPGRLAAVRAARDAREDLLSDETREALERIVAAFTQVEQRRRAAEHEVLAISAALGSVKRGDPARGREVARFDQVEADLAAATEAFERGARNARIARSRLRDEARLREELAPVFDAGDEAEAGLWAFLRARLEAETRRRTLFPAWFTADLGAPDPPRPVRVASTPAAEPEPEDGVGDGDGDGVDDGDAGSGFVAVRPDAFSRTEQWTNTAIAVLSYRMVYEVSDPDSALGPAPGDEAPSHQAMYHDALLTALKALD